MERIKKLLSVLPHPVRYVLTLVIGFVLLILGLIMMVTPGPGLVFIFFGLSILALEIEWARELNKQGLQGLERIVARIKNLKPKDLFVVFAIAEAITWTLLILGLLAKAFTSIAPIVVTVIGGIHGLVFLGYGVSAALVGVNQRWSTGKIILGIALAIVPYATIPFERVQLKKETLEGEWRTTASHHPKDNTWFDRLFRWFINRPVLLVLALLLVVAAIFAALLLVGPPDSWGK
jgi:integral membrane protein